MTNTITPIVADGIESADGQAYPVVDAVKELQAAFTTAVATKLNDLATSSTTGAELSQLHGKTPDYLSTPLLSKNANYSLVAGDSGALILVTAADKVLTLPSTVAGLTYRVVLAAAGLSTGTGLQIAPAAADKIMGDGFTSGDNKAAVLAGSGDREGDSITLVGDGADGWYIVAHEGTWTRAS